MDRPTFSADANFPDPTALAARIRGWGAELGFRHTAITDTDLAVAESRLFDWLADGRHGTMEWLERHGTRRTRPAELVPGTIRIISVALDYWPAQAEPARQVLRSPERAYVSRYAVGRDYHKLMRNRLQKLADRIEAEIGPFGYRAFTDSAPVMEKPLAAKAGIGTMGKHTCVIDRDAGSYFFLGELYTDLPLPVDPPADPDVCGGCRACINACPTGAITGPYQLDARRCISYLTIENPGPIPEDMRPQMGNRIYGCDDCQIVCPWNRHATTTQEQDFRVRNELDNPDLIDLFAWPEDEFLHRMQGSPIRRIGHTLWLRNIAVALGNAPTSTAVIDALQARADHPSELVREHVRWALQRHGATTESA